MQNYHITAKICTHLDGNQISYIIPYILKCKKKKKLINNMSKETHHRIHKNIPGSFYPD